MDPNPDCGTAEVRQTDVMAAEFRQGFVGMKERPILFSAPMVRAILDGTKSQTRRIVKPVRGFEHHNILKLGMPYSAYPWAVWWHSAETDRVGCLQDCPYGQPEDRLWVRETWASPEPDKSKPGRVAYNADGACGCWIGGGEDREFVYHGRVLEAEGYHACFPKGGASTCGLGKYSDIRRGEYPSYRYGWRPSIHMPRWASRITLEITGVRVERVQDISEDDVLAEGIGHDWHPNNVKHPDMGIVSAYRSLWAQINGADSWSRNDWVWVVEFRRLA